MTELLKKTQEIKEVTFEMGLKMNSNVKRMRKGKR